MDLEIDRCARYVQSISRITVATSAGNIGVAGDAIFVERNLEPNPAEKWRHWVPARFVNSCEGWKSVEEIDKRADYVLPCHDEVANARSDVFLMT